MHNVSEATLYWYRASFKTWTKYSAGDPKTWVMGMRAAGLSSRSVNTHICALNAYWRWAGEPIKLAYLKEEQKILQTLSEPQIKALLAYKPTGTNVTRAFIAALVILDTGIRASELLGITSDAIDWDSLVLRVLGKGNKHRLVPFSLELRKRAYSFVSRNGNRFVFGTRNGTMLTIRNLERDIWKLGENVGITGVRFSPHTLRHTMAVSYLRKGGDIYSLSRILGHTSVKTTEIYLRSIGIDDLKRNHSRLSLLCQRH